MAAVICHQNAASVSGSGFTCDERTTVAVGNSCSAPKVRVRAFAGDVDIESGAINVSYVLHSRHLRGDSHWLVSATCRHWRQTALLPTAWPSDTASQVHAERTFE